jgi:hypothetical protein
MQGLQVEALVIPTTRFDFSATGQIVTKRLAQRFASTLLIKRLLPRIGRGNC